MKKLILTISILFTLISLNLGFKDEKK